MTKSKKKAAELFREGDVFDGWVLEASLGAGGNGDVWKWARPGQTSQAIEVLRSVAAETYERFKAETSMRPTRAGTRTSTTASPCPSRPDRPVAVLRVHLSFSACAPYTTEILAPTTRGTTRCPKRRSGPTSHVMRNVTDHHAKIRQCPIATQVNSFREEVCN